MKQPASDETAKANPDCAPATGSVYRFSTFQELVDRVPGDRIRDCMEELGTVLASAKLSTELVAGVARNLAESDGKTLPNPEQIIVLPPEFEWIDDGKRELEARMVDSKGDGLFAVKITPNAALCDPAHEDVGKPETL